MREVLKEFNLKTVFNSDKGIKRFVMMVISVILIGFSVAVFSLADFGVDPFTSMNMGISSKLGMGLGTYQLCVNLVLFIITLIFGKQLIGIGSLANMVFVGYICQLFTFAFSNFSIDNMTVVIRIFLMLTGVILLSFGASLYFTSSLGVAPYDAIGFIIEHKTNLPYKWCRVITDLACTAVALIFSGPVGLGTIVTAFCMGPVISFFDKKVSSKILSGKWFGFKDLKIRYHNFTNIGGGFISSNGQYDSKL